jgi:hypothetical protein
MDPRVLVWELAGKRGLRNGAWWPRTSEGLVGLVRSQVRSSGIWSIRSKVTNVSDLRLSDQTEFSEAMRLQLPYGHAHSPTAPQPHSHTHTHTHTDTHTHTHTHGPFSFSCLAPFCLLLVKFLGWLNPNAGLPVPWVASQGQGQKDLLILLRDWASWSPESRCCLSRVGRRELALTGTLGLCPGHPVPCTGLSVMTPFLLATSG